MKSLLSVPRGMSVLLAAVSVMGLAGCKRTVDPASPDAAQTPEGAACPPAQATISDGEDNNNQVEVIDGRGGYWYTFVDDIGSQVWPTAGSQGGTFEMSPGGANGSQFASRFHGSIGAGEIVYAGMGLNFVDPKGPYDASQYGGISFWAKKAPGTNGKLRLKMPDSNTDPDGGVCSECFNDFGIDISLTEEWQKYTVPFFALSQQKGWGKPRRSEIDKKGVFGVQFQVNESGQPFDIWVDDIQFTGCGPQN